MPGSSAAGPDGSAHERRLRRLGELAGGVARDLNTPLQYIGDNARFLGEAAADLRGVISWYQACVRVLAQGRHARLLEEMSAMERRVDLEHLLAEMPKAILQSLEGVAEVGATVHAFGEFCEAPAGPGLVDLERAIAVALAVSRNQWRGRAELTADPGTGVPPVRCPAAELFTALVDAILAAAAWTVPGGAARVRVQREGDSAVVAIAPSPPRAIAGERETPVLAAARAAAARAGATLTAEAAAEGWSIVLRMPIAAERGAAGAGP